VIGFGVGVGVVVEVEWQPAAPSAKTTANNFNRLIVLLRCCQSYYVGRWGPSGRLNPVLINIPQALDRLCYRYPGMLVDAITEHEPGRRLVAVKNVTVSEEFFQGHFPGAPILPAVLMLESLSQVAAILLVQREDTPPRSKVYLRGVNDAKFRRQIVPGDRLTLEISLGQRRRSLARAQATAFVGDQVVAECELLLGLVPDKTSIHPTANVDPSAVAAARSVRPQSSTGARRSATRPRSFRSPRSDWSRRT
jgi:3-hydroxyacyl-[acyl-carrier-protein] dehydratase